MATTTYGNTNLTRTNPAIYWAIGIALVLALIAFMMMRDRGVGMNPSTPATMTTEPADSTNTNMSGAGTTDMAPGRTTTPGTSTVPESTYPESTYPDSTTPGTTTTPTEPTDP